MFKRKPKLRSLWPAFALVFIVVLAITLRIDLIETRDYWYDEAFTGVVLRQDFSTMNETIINDVHPPLYYWMLKGWTFISGTGPVALRLFSVFFGVGTVILAFIALRNWFRDSWVPAVLGSFLFAINPFLFNYSQEARMYTMLGFLLLLAALLLWKSHQNKHVGWRIAYGVTAAAILLTHYLGFVFMVAFFLYDLWRQYRQHPRFQLREYARWFASRYLIPFVVGIAWLPFFLTQAGNQRSLGWVPNASLNDIATSFHKFLFGSPIGVAGVPPALSYRVDWITVENIAFFLTIGLTALIVWIFTKRAWDKKTGYLAYLAFVPLLLTWLLQFVEMKLYVERFLSGTAIFLLLFLTAALYKHFSKQGIIIATGIYAFLVILIQPWSYTPTFQSVNRTVEQFRDQGPIVFTNPFDFTVARYYAGEDLRSRLRLYNRADVRQDLSDWAIIGEQDQTFSLPENNHLLITEHPGDFNGNYEQINTIGKFAVLRSTE